MNQPHPNLGNLGRKHPSRSVKRLHTLAATVLAALLTSTAAQAVDYGYGSVTQNFTINASDAARDVSGDGSFDNNTGDMGIYWRGSSSDVTYMHFDLSSLAGLTLNGDVSLNYTVNAQYGGNVTGSQLNTANGAWTGTGSAPGYSAIGDAINATGNFSSGQTATWGVPGATFLGFVGNPSYFGLALSGASGTTAHLTGTPTLTGNATGGEIRVVNATDWSAATFDSGTKILTITNADNVSGGNVFLSTGTTLAVGGDATLDSGSFAGNFNNSGTLSFGSSVAQTLTGTISGSGSLTKTGSGTLSLYAGSGDNNANVYYQNLTGGLNILSGTVEFTSQYIRMGSITIGNGGTLRATVPWATGASNPWFGGRSAGSITVNAGGTLHSTTVGNSIMEGLTLNGGTVSGSGGGSGDWGNFIIASQVTAAGATTSTISAELAVAGTQTFDVATNSTLNISGTMHNRYAADAGGLTKTGNGTLVLSGANSYTGVTTLGSIAQGSLGSYTTANTYSFSPVSSNLLAGLSPSAHNVSAPEGSGNIAVLTDGQCAAGSGSGTTITIGNNQYVTYTLRASTYGYNITNINVYAGWADSGRENISLSDISYSTVFSPNTFVPIAGSGVNYEGGANDAVAHLTASGAVLAYNVYAIRFNFGGQENNYVGYRELEAAGTPAAGPAVVSGGTLLVTNPTGSGTGSGSVAVIAGTLQVGDGSVDGAIGGPISINQSGSLVFNTASAQSHANAISGSGSLIKRGPGTLTLSGSASYLGTTWVEAGVLDVASLGSLPASTLDITNGAKAALNYSGQIIVTNLVLNGVVQGGGTHGATGSGAANINDTYFSGTGVIRVATPAANQVFNWTAAVNNTWDTSTANWTNSNGYSEWFNNVSAPNSALFGAQGAGPVNVVLAGSLYAGNLTFNAGGYDFTNGSLALGNSPTIVANADVSFRSAIGGSGGLIKSGNATLTLLGANTYGGGTTIGTGALQIGDGLVDGSMAGAVSVASGASLVFNTAVAQSYGNTVSGAGSLIKQGPGNLSFSGGTAWSGGTIVNGGLMQIYGDWKLANGPITINNGATLKGTDAAAGLTGSFTLNGGTLDGNGSGNGDWGHFIIYCDVGASGNSTISARCALRTAAVTFNVTNGGNLTVSGVLINGVNYGSYGGTPTVVTKAGAGTMTFIGAETYTGPTTISGGTLQIGDGATDGSIASSSLTANAALVFNVAGAQSCDKPISGSGVLVKTGPGGLSLSGNNGAFLGLTRVLSGNLSVEAANAVPPGNLDITNGATMTLNYSGQATVSGLVLDGAAQPVGTYGATGSGADHIDDTHFTGTGVIRLFIPPANQLLTWTAAVDNNWDATTANWTNSTPFSEWFNNPASPNSALFGAQGAGAVNVAAGLGTLYANTLTFSAPGYDIGGGALTLGNTPALVVNSSATISSVLNGPGGVVKTGTGTLTLSGANSTYGGATTVGAGTLVIAGAGGFDPNVGGGAVTVSNGATVQITTSANNALAFQGGTPAWVVAGTINVTGGGANSIPGAGVVLNNGTLTGTGSNPWGTFLAIQANPNTITANGAGNVISSGDFAIFTGVTLALNTPLAGDTLVASTGFKDVTGQGAGSLTKTGLGTVLLNGNNSYSGSTTVSGGTLGGSGTISGVVTVGSGGTLTAGSTLGAIGTLTLDNDLTLNAGANVLVKLNKSLVQSNSLISVAGLLANNGAAAVTLTVSNLGPALVVGDKFKVFSKAFDQDGGLVTIVAPAGYAFSNGLAVDGSITVTAVPSTTPPVLGVSQSGNSLTFSWSGSGILQSQTNTLATGLGTNWMDYPGGGTSPVTVTIDPAKPSVFFRVKQ